MRVISFLGLLIFGFAVLDVSGALDNQYKNEAGRYYWGNKKPNAAYWQQDVHYQIKAKINDIEESIAGNEVLRYFNNSPDTLYKVYFHLYQNAFTPESYAHQLRKSGKISTTFGEHELNGLGTVINSIKVGGKSILFSVDNTILIIELKRPIPPKGSEVFVVDFKTYWDKGDKGNMRRRMKTFAHDGVTHFDGVHWYPRICVYDRKFGWTTDQHLGKEFYGDFGLFEVELTFPNQYILEATGELQNENEVLPRDLRESIDLKHYAGSKVPLKRNPIPTNGTTKTWKYKAVNVHDFAFTADPSYRIGEASWKGIKCIALAQEQNAHRWQPTAKFASEVIRTYSEEIGMYGYPKIVVADARDGMEYPMITLNSGNWPRHQYVIAHEVGHNWFFGMIGNNETYRASLDEGFTQYLTALSLKKISKQDEYGNRIDKSVVFNSYLYHAAEDNNAILATHSDHFNSAERHGGGYGQVYFKTATMLYNLEYVLGDELFKKCIQEYFEKWKFAHPYWEDFKTSIIRSSGSDLNWFFDQWINTNKKIDYKVKSVKSSKDGEQIITLRRKGESQMPVDLEVTFDDGSTENHYIPNTYFEKSTMSIKQAKWTGWDQLNKNYSFPISNTKKIENVTIDPTQRLADIYQLDNSLKTPIDFRYSSYRRTPEDFRKYNLRWHPNIWYNSLDGIKAGMDVSGNYIGKKHLVDATLWYNTEIASDINLQSTSPISYKAIYKNRIAHLLDLELESRFLDGLNYNRLALTKRVNKNKYSVSAKSLYRKSPRDLDYLIYSQFWNTDRWNNSLNLNWNRTIKFFNGSGRIDVNTRSAFILSDYNYSMINAEFKRDLSWKKLAIRLRGFAQYGTGDFAPEAKLLLSGSNVEDMMDNPWTRSVGFVPSNLTEYGNQFNSFHNGGGLNLRGFTGYEALNESVEDGVYYIFTGNSGIAVNGEIDFAKKVGINRIGRRITSRTYLFADAGILQGDSGGSSLRADAGLGATFTVKPLRMNYIKPFTIRVDFPFFVNRIPNNQSNYLDLRYVIGFSRAF